MELKPGTTLQGRYRIARQLGQGGMGAVYRAWDTRLNISVAVKEMVAQPGLQPPVLLGLRQQFQEEARILARLNHPHLVRVTDSFEEGENAYLVMDFVEGENLCDLLIQRGAQPESRVLAWAGTLLEALAYCHAQGIIHRDIKPQNIILRPDGTLVLVDFGLVKLWDPDHPHTRTAMHGMGTPAYAPPEQYDASFGHTDPRSDLYGLGATLYHTLTGQMPPSATRRMIEPQVLQPIRTFIPDVSEATQRAIMQALELLPDRRFPDAAAMARALGSYNGQPESAAHTFTTSPGATRPVTEPAAPPPNRVPPPPPTEPVAPPAGKPARRSRNPFWFLAAGGTLLFLICACGIGTWFVFQNWPLLAFPTSLPTDDPVTVGPGITPTVTDEITPDAPTPIRSRPIDPVTVESTAAAALRLLYINGPVANSDIYVALEDGSQTRCVACEAGCDEAEAGWAPDSRRIVYQSNCAGTYDLWIADADSPSPTQLTVDNGLDEREPDWSPDGQWIAFRVNSLDQPRDENGELWLVNTTSGQFNDLKIQGRAPAWSPDNRTLAFMSNQDGSWEIYLYSLIDGRTRQLTRCESDCRWPAWSPDGHYVLFHSTTEARSATADTIWAISAEGNESLTLVTGEHPGRPTWSAQGWIAFNSDRGIEMLNRDTGVRRLLISNQTADPWAPAWSR